MKKPRQIFSLLPLLIFLFLYLSIGTYFFIKDNDYAFYQFPASSCILFAFAFSLVIGFRNIKEQIEYFLDGIRSEYVVIMLLIFLLAGAFASVMKGLGGVESTVNMCLSFIPQKMILPGLFIISCFISLAMGTSMGTLSAVVPIALGLAQSTHISIPLTMGVVLGGAMFGDNLSIISDTTVAATSIQQCKMNSKFKMNFKIILPAVIVTLLILCFVGNPQIESKEYIFSYIKVFPYLIVFILALCGINVVVILTIGIFLAGVIGLSANSFNFLDFGKIIHEGFMSMTEVIFLTFFISGLSALAIERGGLDYILHKLNRYISSKRSAEFGIASLVSIADICTANNTIAIILTGKIAKKISKNFQIQPARTASLLDIFASAWQGILPYGAQILLIGSLAKISPFSIVIHSWYPILLAISGIIAIIINRP
ncbi:MAG: Na+/H+ antiporter NhaC family protein [Rickettsiales bacterium]|nr:Na+/H+ antiporter NhaC family protein [Rickettsiales bacterium]